MGLRTTVVHVSADGHLLAERPAGPRPGDIWFESDWLGSKRLSGKYYALPEPRRLPIVVCLPTGTLFCVDMKQSTKEKGFFDPGWDVSGPIAQLTVRPSINIPNHWHGHLTDGLLEPG